MTTDCKTAMTLTQHLLAMKDENATRAAIELMHYPDVADLPLDSHVGSECVRLANNTSTMCRDFASTGHWYDFHSRVLWQHALHTMIVWMRG